jgi:chromosome segregation ATPase
LIAQTQGHHQEAEKLYQKAQKDLYEFERKKEFEQKKYSELKEDLHQKIQSQQQSQSKLDQLTLNMQWTQKKIEELASKKTEFIENMNLLAESLQRDEKEGLGVLDDNLSYIQLTEQFNQSCEKITQLRQNILEKDQDHKNCLTQYHHTDRELAAIQLEIKNNNQHLGHKKESLKNLEKDRDHLALKGESLCSMPYEVRLASLSTDLEEQIRLYDEDKLRLKELAATLQGAITQRAVVEHDFKVAMQKKIDLERHIQSYQRTQSSWLEMGQKASAVTLGTWDTIKAKHEYFAALSTQFFYKGERSVSLEQIQLQADLDLEYVWGTEQPSYWKSYIPIESAEQALNHLSELSDHQAYLLKGGVLLGKNWIRPWRKRAPILTQLLQDQEDSLVHIAQLNNEMEKSHDLIKTLSSEHALLEKKTLQQEKSIESLKQQVHKQDLEIERLKQAQKDWRERQKHNAYLAQQTLETIARIEKQCQDRTVQLEALKVELLHRSEQLSCADLALNEYHLSMQPLLREKEQYILAQHEIQREYDRKQSQYRHNKKQYEHNRYLVGQLDT